MKKTTQQNYLQIVGLNYSIDTVNYKDFIGGQLEDKQLLMLTLATDFIAEDGERKTFYRQHNILEAGSIRDLSLDLEVLKKRIASDEFNKYNWYNIYKLLEKHIEENNISEKR